jgi:hypothetical protein
MESAPYSAGASEFISGVSLMKIFRKRAATAALKPAAIAASKILSNHTTNMALI